MSCEVELNGKAGRVCQQALQGEIHCPLIVRQNSEDVMTGTVLGSLRHIRPHLWLGPLLNLGLGTDRFRQAWYKNLSIRFWERQSRFPPELLDFREGRTEVDAVIEWENPRTTVWIEAKLFSELSEGTTHSRNNDQAIRGIRTLLATTGHIQPERLFHVEKREAVWLALLSDKPNQVVDAYRNTDRLMERIGNPERIGSLPIQPFVGTITWMDIQRVLIRGMNCMTTTEKSVSRRLIEYLDAKSSNVQTSFLRPV